MQKEDALRIFNFLRTAFVALIVIVLDPILKMILYMMSPLARLPAAGRFLNLFFTTSHPPTRAIAYSETGGLGFGIQSVNNRTYLKGFIDRAWRLTAFMLDFARAIYNFQMFSTSSRPIGPLSASARTPAETGGLGVGTRSAGHRDHMATMRMTTLAGA